MLLPPPTSLPSNFWTPLCERQKGSSTKLFGSVRQKNWQNRDTPITQKKFDSITFLKYKGAPRKFFGTVRHEIFQRKNVIPHPPPDPKFFSIPKNFWNLEGFPLRSVSVVWDKKMSTENHDPPLQKVFSIPEVFQYTELFQQFFFGTVRQQLFDTKSWYSPLRHKVFR